MADVALNFSNAANPKQLPSRLSPGLLVNHVGSAGDTEKPVIVSINPPNAATLQPGDAITIVARDNLGMRRLIVNARFAGQAVEEMVFNGTRFAANYAGGSTSQVNLDGQGRPTTTLVVKRAGGWPADQVTWEVFAIDTAGNEA